MFGNSREILEEKHRELEELMGLNNVENAEAVKKVKEEINTRLYNDELHWHQRSKSIWLQAGDKNTKFFIKEQVNGGGKIILVEFMIMIGCGGNRMRG